MSKPETEGTAVKQTVWVVRFVNYYPAEIDAIFATRELAETRCDALGGMYVVEEWKIINKEIE